MNYTIFNETKCLDQWLIDSRAAIGLYPKLFRTRLRQKWSPEKALTMPVKNKPNGYGQYVYGYPFSLCDEIAPNYWEIPNDPDKYTYWTSEDKKRNVHFRAGKFRCVENGVIVGEADSYLQVIEQHSDVLRELCWLLSVADSES